MNENGDAGGNYTLLAMDNSKEPGLYPLAVLHESPMVTCTYFLYLNLC